MTFIRYITLNVMSTPSVRAVKSGHGTLAQPRKVSVPWTLYIHTYLSTISEMDVLNSDLPLLVLLHPVEKPHVLSSSFQLACVYGCISQLKFCVTLLGNYIFAAPCGV
jgi:hypothetical protein